MFNFGIVAASAELLVDGVDISKLTKEDIRQQVTGKRNEFYIQVDEGVKEFFNLPSVYVLRDNRAFFCVMKKKDFKANLTLSIEKCKDIMRLLYESDIECFPDIDEHKYIPDFDKMIQEIDKDFVPDYEMISKLTKENTDEALRVFLALFNYPNQYSKKLYDDSKKHHVFHINSTYDVIDDRMYIWLKPSDIRTLKKLFPDISPTLCKAKAFVVSKNVYDYFWASYGNEFESCFSLNSEYSYLYGYLPFALAPESFICYLTTGSVNKIPVISGKQFLCPNMLMRCWGYASSGGDLLVDKRYGELSTDFYTALFKLLSKKIALLNDVSGDRISLYSDGKNIKKILADTGCSFYSDSLLYNSSGEIVFSYNGGLKCVSGIKPIWKKQNLTFIQYASQVTSVSPTFNLAAPAKIVNGVLMNPKTCPVTGFEISETEKVSPFAKYFTKNCKSSIMLTYLDGSVFIDTKIEENNNLYTSHFSFGGVRNFQSSILFISNYRRGTSSDFHSISLKTLKEHIKGYIKELPYDGVLLRWFEDDAVKYQFFKNVKDK